MVWGNVAAAGAGALGSFLGAKEGNQDNFGWGNQWADDHNQAVKNAVNHYSNLPTQRYFGSSPVAPMNADRLRFLQEQAAFGSPTGQGGMNTYVQGLTGVSNLAAGRSGVDFMRQRQQQGPNQFQGSQFGYDQGTFDQTMGNLMPGLQGAYDSAMRDPTRQFNEQTIPGIKMAAAGAGQQFGTAPQKQSAIAARGLADRGADTASALWMNAANQAQNSAMTGGVQNLGADLTAGRENMEAAGRYDQMLINGYQNAGQLGTTQLNQAYNMGQGNNQMRQNTGNALQGYDQSLVDAEKARWDFAQQAPHVAAQNQIDMWNSIKLGGTPGPSGSSSLATGVQGALAGLGVHNAFTNSQSGGGNPYIPPPQNQFPTGGFGGGWDGSSYGNW